MAASVRAVNSSVAVCYSGWLAVSIPQRGATAQRHLVSVLGADVFLAGTFRSNDCARARSSRDARVQCLLQRLGALQPLARVSVEPMLTYGELRRRVTRSPSWPRIAAGFDAAKVYDGVSVWAPLLGSRNLSVLRELHDYSRVLTLVEQHERQRGARYSRVVFSRLEFEWHAPHPPLSVLTPGAVWLPSGGVNGGVNDRHALLDRKAADVYFRRWELLTSAGLFDRVPERVLLRDGPEQLLRSVLEAAKLEVRYFPSTMALACCGAAGRCYGGNACVGFERVRLPGGPRGLRGKYLDELKFAARHASALACPGARYASPPAESGRQGAAQREAGVVIELPAPRPEMWHPDPSVSGRAFGSLPHSGQRARRAPSTGASRLGYAFPVFTHWTRVVPSASAEASMRRLLLRADGRMVDTRADGWTDAPPGTATPRAIRKSAGLWGLAGEPADAHMTHGTIEQADEQCPSRPRHWWPHGAVAGYCEETEEQKEGPSEGDCAFGDKGSFGLFHSRGLHDGRLVSIGECARLCAACARCRYISLSLAPDVVDCSWYHSCDLSATKSLSTGPDFVSMRLSSALRYDALCRARYKEEAC